MNRLICIQSSSDYSYTNICDFKATETSEFSRYDVLTLVLMKIHFFHYIVTDIWELAASNNSIC
jgi:hypothetical protein